MSHHSRIRRLLALALLVVLGMCEARPANFFVDNATQFNALTDKFGADFSTLNAGDRVYLKGGTTWGGIVATLTGSMTDARAQADPAIIYACDSNYNPTAGGVVIGGVSQITLAGSGVVFAGVTFGPSSGMKQVGTYSDYSPSDGNAYLIATAGLSRYMTISHITFDHCGSTCTSVNDHSGPWINVAGFHHTIQYCDFQGRDFNPNDVNVTDNGFNRTSIHGPTITFGKDSADTVDWGFHAVRYNFFGQRLVPDSNDARLYTPADGADASTLTNGWETIRIGVGSLSIYNFNVIVEYNAFYHSIQAVDGSPTENSGEPEMISSKSNQNTIRYNTFLNNYGHVSLRQGDYCVVQGNCFLGGGAYDAAGDIVLTETPNIRMGGVRVFGFGHTIANNYFYNLSGNSGSSYALVVGNGTTATGTLASLSNADNGTTTYETANYSQIFNNTFINCNTLTLGDSQSGSNTPFATQFFNNVIYYGGDIGGGGITADAADALSNHGGQARGNYVFSATASQLGSASTMLGANNTVTSSADPLMTDTFNVLTVPASNSPLIAAAQTLPAINDTSPTGPSYNLAGNVATQGGLDVRGLARPATGRDIGDFQHGATGAPVRPLLRSEVGVVAATLPNYPVVGESFPGNTRTTQNPPDSLTWYCNGTTGSNTRITNGALTLTWNNATRQAIAYFPTQSLNVGDALTLSFNFSVTAPLNASKGLRAGLLFTGTSRITGDANANPTNYTGTGYGTFINPVPPTTGSPVVLVKRGGSGTIVTTPVNTAWVVNGSGGAVQPMVAGTTYDATITIRRTATSQVTSTTTYNGGTWTPVSVTATDNASVNTSFDTIALGFGNNTIGSITYSGITLTKSTPLIASTGSTSAVVNHTVDFNLKTLVTSTGGPFMPLTFTVSSPLNGTVSLLSDGITARFTPNSNYTGAASFAYNVTDGTNTTASSVSLNFGNKLPAGVTLGNLAPTYDGTAKPATYTTSPGGLNVDLTYDDGTGATSTAPANAGSYAVTGIINSATYAGLATGTLVISKATAGVTLDNLSQTFDGTAKTPTVTTAPPNLTVGLTFDDGSGNGPTTTAPSAIGSYTVVATIGNANYSGSATGTLVISPTAAGVIFPDNLVFAFDGNAKTVTPTTIPPGLAVSVTYNGSTTPPSAIGSYSVVGTVTDPNYSGSATATLVIQSAASPITTAGAATWVCPANVATIQIECWGGGGAGGSAQRTGSSGSVQYGGGGAGGAYAKLNSISVVPGTTYYLNVGAGGVNNSAVTGTTIAGGDSWFNATNTPSGTIIAKGGAGGASAIGTTTATRYGTGGTGTTTASAGDVIFAGGGGATASASGAGGGGSGAGSAGIGTSATTYVGATAPTGGGNGGTGTVNNSLSGTDGNQPGGGGGGARDSSNVTIAGGAGGPGKVLITVNKFVASVVLGNLQQTFDGTPKPVTATTAPPNLTVAITYDGSNTVPTAAGTYAVVATISDTNYAGSATDVLVVAEAITAWRQLYFSTAANIGVAADSNDADGDGFTNLQEYNFGTLPTTSNSTSLLTLAIAGANTIELSFVAKQSAGTGYAGLTRHYAVETTTDLSNASSWVPVTGYSDTVGANQTVSFTQPRSEPRRFYRLKAWLK